jgi:hypothetical protein
VAHTFDDLIEKQQAADQAHDHVEQLLDDYGSPTREGGWSDEQTEAYETAWRAWRDLAAEVQAAVTEYAQGQGKARNAVEADVKKAVRHPEAAAA